MMESIWKTLSVEFCQVMQKVRLFPNLVDDAKTWREYSHRNCTTDLAPFGILRGRILNTP